MHVASDTCPNVLCAPVYLPHACKGEVLQANVRKSGEMDDTSLNQKMMDPYSNNSWRGRESHLEVDFHLFGFAFVVSALNPQSEPLQKQICKKSQIRYRTYSRQFPDGLQSYFCMEVNKIPCSVCFFLVGAIFRKKVINKLLVG